MLQMVTIQLDINSYGARGGAISKTFPQDASRSENAYPTSTPELQ